MEMSKKDSTKQLKEQLLRMAADFENYKKNQEKHKAELMTMANHALILKIVPALDNFRRAFKQLPKDLEQNEWVAGVKQVEKQLEDILKEEGVGKIESEGAKFDPALHEALTHEEYPELPAGHIIEELESGYKMGQKVLKVAKVRVSRGK